MSRIMIVGDSHWGISSNNQRMVQQNIDVWNYILDLAKDYKCGCIIETGDFLDKRKEIDTNLLKTIQQTMLAKLNEIGIPMYMIVGNHNLYFKDTSRVNNIDVFEAISPWCHVIKEPISFGHVDLIPWINNSNVEQIKQFILDSNSQYCFGHLELSGFSFDKSRVAEANEILSQSTFKRYKKVFSGHYHIKSSKNNIMYVGTPHQLTWIDVDVEKYVHILDTETGDITEIIIPFELFKQFEITEDNWKDYCNDELKDKKVKIFYEDGFDTKLFNDIQTQFVSINPDIQFIKKPSKEKKQKVITIDESQSLLDSVLDYVNNIQPDNKDKIDLLLKKVYNTINTTQE